jgi:lysozyme
MRLNKEGIKILHDFEGLKLNAYLCPANVWTIGYGNTRYENGQAVQRGERITRQRAEELFTNIVNRDFVPGVRRLVTANLNENQFSALVSFAYNLGTAALGRSTLLRLINANPNNPAIRAEFMKWNRAGGRVLNGLTRRREAEANLYFKI